MRADALLIRADGSVAIGTGHVMRCLALAQAWQDAGGKAVFAMAETTPAIQARLEAEGFEVFRIPRDSQDLDDASRTTGFGRKVGARWIVVDGYQFSAEYQHAVKNEGFKLLVLDDYAHAQHYYADVVLNQNGHANEVMYKSRERRTYLLLGPHYCLLRREFAAYTSWQRKITPEARRVLITMGGSDAGNLAGRAIEAVSRLKLKDLTATVVVGGSTPHFESPRDAAATATGKVRVLRDISNLAELMADSDVAISAAGTTCWELCLLGLPSLLIDVAAHQTPVATEIHAKGCAIHIGDSSISAEQIAGQLEHLIDSQALRESLSMRSRELLDGRGAERVVSVLQGTEGLRLRRAKGNDSRVLSTSARGKAAVHLVHQKNSMRD